VLALFEIFSTTASPKAVANGYSQILCMVYFLEDLITQIIQFG